MSTKLVRSVVEYILMVGIPISGIVLILNVGQSHKAVPPLGKTWQLQPPKSQSASSQSASSQSATDSIARCYGLKPPITIQIEQSGRFLHASIGKHSAQGKINENIWHFDFTPNNGECAGKNTRLHGEIQEKEPNWPAILESESCTKCAPIHVMIYRKKG